MDGGRVEVSELSQVEGHVDDGPEEDQEEGDCAGGVEGPRAFLVNGPYRNSVKQDGKETAVVEDGGNGFVEVGLLGCTLDPLEHHEEDEGEEGRGDEHEVAEDDVLGVVAGRLGDGGVGEGLLLALGDSLVVAVEGREDDDGNVDDDQLADVESASVAHSYCYLINISALIYGPYLM